ncbi:hypothetical protein [Brevundimonas sp. GCM10030266]|uniref:hypothetical protein n=1 Tax=Brevundimonas sp. GCM10030266 TaxID=3273386 RepID=UPI003607CC89
MFITSINIAREGYYGHGRNDPTKPLRAVVQVEGQHGKVELNLSPEASDRMVALIAEEIVEATKATAALMTSGVLTGAKSDRLAAPKGKGAA